MYKSIIKPLLFLLSPEKAHHFTFLALKLLMKIPGAESITRSLFAVNNKRLQRNVAGLNFPSPVGLAAGFDKNALLFDELAAFGFGFIEIGTVTPKPQHGNEKPRLFRLPEDEALINRMGFNNDGMDLIAERLKNRKPGLIVGGNIGKNKITPNEEAEVDYRKCFETLFEYVDYFVVNVSSPNTPGLRALQDKEPLTKLLAGLQQLNQQKAKPKPIFLKIAPDLTDPQLDEIIDIIVETKLSGIIATNTTISREGLKTSKNFVDKLGPGGLSGKPLTIRSTDVIRYISQKAKGRFFIVGAGGIHSEKDALDKLNAGAHLVQLYTGFIYEGPSLVKRINKAVLAVKKS